MLQPIYLNAVPSPGSLLGTEGTADIIRSINLNMGMDHGFFGSVNDVFQAGRQAFVQNIIEPIRRVTTQLKNTAAKLLRNDVIVPLVTIEDFHYVPPKMHMPILMYEPVRALHAEGRIDGFGYNAEDLPTEDVYGRLISNGRVDDVRAAMDKTGTFEVHYCFDSMDPELSFEELDYIDTTRQAIDELLANTSVDPTNAPMTRG